jgi:hypothetical protein
VGGDLSPKLTTDLSNYIEVTVGGFQFNADCQEIKCPSLKRLDFAAGDELEVLEKRRFSDTSFAVDQKIVGVAILCLKQSSLYSLKLFIATGEHARSNDTARTKWVVPHHPSKGKLELTFPQVGSFAD